MGSRPLRVIGIAVGALIILAVGVYGPATLLGPLPSVAIEHIDSTTTASAPIELRLPETGASAVSLVHSGSGEPEPLASSGIEDAVPLGGATKLITALVAIDAHSGPASLDDELTIEPDDYRAYLDYASDDARVLDVLPGETWTVRDVIRAVLLSSSNNHADTLARWAYGSVGAYVVAANVWLAEHGFSSIHVADATGLSADNVGSATELAQIAGLVMTEPALAAVYDTDSSVSGARLIPDVSAHLADIGIRSLSRSFTDQAGLGLVFVAETASDGEPVTLVAAFLRMPDYETLDPAVADLVSSMADGFEPVIVIAEGERYATASAPWGDRANVVAGMEQSTSAFSGATATLSLETEPFATGSAGQVVGRIRAETENGTLSSPLELDADIRDPGPIWRLLNPVPVIATLLDSQSVG